MGSLFAPKVQAAPTPPEPKDYNVVDNVSGTKQTVVTGADGNKTVVIEENLTPEQQAIKDNLKKISDEALTKYQSLVNDPLLQDPAYADVRDAVQTIYDNQVKSLGDAYKGASTATEKAAARFGVEDSTTANLLRSQNTKNYAGALEQAAADKVGLTNQYRQQEMANQLGLYGTASGRQDTLYAQGMQTLGLGNTIAMQNAARNDAYQQNLYNQQNALNIARANAQAQGMGAIGTLVGMGLGGWASGGFKTGFGATGSAGNLTNNYNVTGLRGIGY